ncbi:MAG: hypothetical protein AUI47_08380 [Acidobacteria bacterium 13_1_40CM_2_68_5]|nr:MAG: hypothetical protein AUI47_08380 [Acidobacteria bacterium 13_1_40CM_2_68_5]OLE67007.1 MAG: hypothetical protein AUG09_04615 [Acidobacteria bacterium 13_1_20CM_2_68_7]
MKKGARYAVRTLMFAVLALAFTVALSPTAYTPDPYTSALSSLAVGSGVAASTCPDKTCDFHLRKYRCVSAAGSNCQLFHGGWDCQPTAC